ncbi:class I SAM-dependent methyltransferase [Nocardioides sp. W7]|uniref:class I SAM-dependent methyltransferase n=1 Tax=Nocardioides sp. W7 TaxID=2931390 RepID=UPI001FD1B2DC|nr:class I SAM-dependent methyltransferase [Nocardioides sp. W7]
MSVFIGRVGLAVFTATDRRADPAAVSRPDVPGETLLLHTGHVDAKPYDALAGEYYDAAHKTSRNFDATTIDAVATLQHDLPTGKVLEVGAGRGRANEFLNIDSNRIVQLDNSAAMLRLQPREASLVRVLNDAESLPFPDGEFSVVLAFLCDPFLGLNFLSEARRVLTSGGVLLGTTPSEVWGRALRGKLDVDQMETRFMLRTGSIAKVPSALYSVSQLKLMLEAAGFDPTSIKISSYSLPEGVQPVSADVTSPAEQLGLSPYRLPILDLFEARAV